jgi:hypothetical protein
VTPRAMGRPAALLACALLAVAARAEEPLRPQPRRFTARVADVRLNGDLVKQGKSLDGDVTVNVRAVLFEKPIRIADARKAEPTGIPLVDALVSYVRVNLEGSAREMAAFWVPAERKEQLEDMTNPVLFERNRSYLRDHPGLVVVGMIFQKDTTSVLVEHGDPIPGLAVLGVSFADVGGKPLLTNHPSDDLELAIVEASFARGSPARGDRPGPRGSDGGTGNEPRPR